MNPTAPMTQATKTKRPKLTWAPSIWIGGTSAKKAEVVSIPVPKSASSASLMITMVMVERSAFSRQSRAQSTRPILVYDRGMAPPLMAPMVTGPGTRP